LDDLLSDIHTALAPVRPPGDCAGLGVGFPALGDYKRGILDGDRSLFPCVGGFPLEGHLSERYRLPVRMTTDANLFALGVARFGEGRGHDNILALTLGTGVGIGVILGGVLYEGSRGIPDEILAVLQENDRPLSAAGHHFQRLYGADGATLAGRAAGGHTEARQSFRFIGLSLGETIRGLLTVLPRMDAVIIGGGVARSWRFFAPTVGEALVDLGIPVIRTQLAHPALRGAAALFR
jgi:glucokinase